MFYFFSYLKSVALTVTHNGPRCLTIIQYPRVCTSSGRAVHLNRSHVHSAFFYIFHEKSPFVLVSSVNIVFVLSYMREIINCSVCVCIYSLFLRPDHGVYNILHQKRAMFCVAVRLSVSPTQYHWQFCYCNHDIACRCIQNIAQQNFSSPESKIY